MYQDWLEPPHLDSPFRETTLLQDLRLFPPPVSFLFDLPKQGDFFTEALELAGSATYLFDRRKAHNVAYPTGLSLATPNTYYKNVSFSTTGNVKKRNKTC